MTIDMIMPQMGESIVEGTILKWRKRTGEPVRKDEIILEISTDKVDSEIPSPADGVLSEILAEEGTTVAVGTPIARISSEMKEMLQGAPTPTPALRRSESLQLGDGTPETRENRRFLSPVVKKMIAEHGLTATDLAAIVGSGANGRITKNDVLAFLQQRQSYQPAIKTIAPMATTDKTAAPIVAAATMPSVAAVVSTPTEDEIIPMDHFRKRIAEHMLLSKQTSAHVTSVAEVDMTAIVQYREGIKKTFEQREGFPLTYTAFFIAAAARALKEFPMINASVDQDRIILKKQINIGIAVGLENGLIVPVVRQADRLNLVGIARTIADLAERARHKKLHPEEVQGGTFSITNIGTYGNLFGTPIINQPQVAILGTGAIKKRPVIVNDAIAIRSMMYLSLTYDHRIIDGLYAGRFLQRIVEILESFTQP